MKGAGMLVVSLRGVNFEFLSHFGFSGLRSSYAYVAGVLTCL